MWKIGELSISKLMKEKFVFSIGNRSLEGVVTKKRVVAEL